MKYKYYRGHIYNFRCIYRIDQSTNDISIYHGRCGTWFGSPNGDSINGGQELEVDELMLELL